MLTSLSGHLIAIGLHEQINKMQTSCHGNNICKLNERLLLPRIQATPPRTNQLYKSTKHQTIVVLMTVNSTVESFICLSVPCLIPHVQAYAYALHHSMCHCLTHSDTTYCKQSLLFAIQHPVLAT